MPQTRPSDLQRWDFMLPRAGWVDTDFPIGGEAGGVTRLYNMRVSRDGLETAPGWVQMMMFNVPTSYENFVGCRSVITSSGVAFTFIFFNRGIYMYNPVTDSVIDVTPQNLVHSITIIPDVVVFRDKCYFAHLDGVYELDPSSSNPRWTLINGSPGARTIGVLGHRLVVGDVVGANSWTLRWSGLDNAEVWDPLFTLELPQYDTILRLLPLGNILVVVTYTRLYGLSYTGNPVTPFAVQFLSQLPSKLSEHESVISIGLHDVRMLVYATPEGVFAFSGNESVMLSANIYNHYRETYEFYGPPRLAYDPTNSEVWVYWNNIIYAYQVLFRSWYSRDIPSSNNAITSIGLHNTYGHPQMYPLFVTFDTNTRNVNTFKLRSAWDTDQRRWGSSFDTEIVLPVIELGAVGGTKTLVSYLLWWSLYGERSLAGGVWTANIAVANAFSLLTELANIQWQHEKTLMVNGEHEEIGVYATGRYVRVRIKGLGLTSRVVWHGLSLFWH